jgi:NAD(P)-dependent dehydrogenase (short-subunit alcohol dehydrogenase family)
VGEYGLALLLYRPRSQEIKLTDHRSKGADQTSLEHRVIRILHIIEGCEEIMKILDRFRLDGKIALVTGGGRGLGKAYSKALAESGADIVIADIQVDWANETAEEVRALGKKALAIEADVSKKSDVKAMIDQIKSEWGRLDIAINNAGITEVIDAVDIEEKNWDSIMEVDLRGVFLCTQAEGKIMIPNKYGKIINISSILGHFVNHTEFQVPYSVAKAGVLHLTRCFAAEWAQYGIRVNCISPGYINTPILDTDVFQKIIPVWIEQTPLGRMGEVTDLQAAVVYLASEVSDFMTGNDLVIDGGFLLMK